MTEEQSKSGSSAAVVIVIVVVLLLFLLCGGGLVLFGGALFFTLQAPQPMPLPPVPGANAPLPGNPAFPGGMTIPSSATITVNNLQWSQNLFDASEGILTLAKFDQIKPGMTYEELLSVLAIPENRRPPDIELVGPESDVELKWFGGPDDALSISVKMKGKVVIDKTQSGLK